MKFVPQLGETWKKMPAVARVVVAGAGGLVLVALIVVAVLNSRGPKMQTLFTGLDPKDAAEVVARLEKEKVEYKLDAGGAAILVSERDVHRMRLMLAAEGLPNGGAVGFELMDRTSIGATDFDRRVNYLRALQGELARTIMQIDGVEAARVHIVLPEQSLFVSNAQPATAAVMIKVRPLAEIDKGQVRGIANLVSKSVEGLKPEEVTIIDYTGKVLSSDYGSQANADSQAGSFFELKMGFQKELERSVQSLLERALGAGNVVARVNADLNFDQTTVTKSLFTPAADGEGLARSVRELQEVFQGTGEQGGGVPGVPSNVPGYSGASGGGGGSSSYEKSETVKNVEINEVREQTVVAPGSVKRLSVAVIVNRDLTAAETTAIENTIASAVGIDPKRQDTISVTGMQFDTSLVDQLKKEMEQQKAPARDPRLVYVGAGLGAFVLVAVAVMSLRRKRKKAPEPAEAVAATPFPEIDADMGPSSRAKEQIEKLVKQNPEGVAQLLKTWLAEQR
ncbi:MAG: flagellar basal-body MS-ring/collar protein FliF [Ignavibacteriales bacterium]